MLVISLILGPSKVLQSDDPKYFFFFLFIFLGRPGFQVPKLDYPSNVDSHMLILKKEFAWHVGGALTPQEAENWRLLYHSSIHGLSFNTFTGNIS